MKIKNTDIQKLRDLIDKLEFFKCEIEKINYTHEKKEFFDLMKDFRKYIATIKDKELFEIFSHSKDYDKYKNFYSDINMYYVRTLEAIQSLSIMTKGIHGFNSFIDLIDREFVRECYEKKGEEIKSLDFTNAKTLLVVGCGPMPETLLYMYENTDIDEIIGIDNNHEAIFMAGEMINGLKLDKITLYQAEGTEYNYKNVDIVYIPLFVYPKEKVINQIVKTGKESVQILINSPKGLGKLLYDDMGRKNPRLKITYRDDAFSTYKAQEMIKLEKYDF